MKKIMNFESRGIRSYLSYDSYFRYNIEKAYELRDKIVIFWDWRSPVRKYRSLFKYC